MSSCSEESDDFSKVADMVPDMHHLNTILKVFEVESVVVRSIDSPSLATNYSQTFKNVIEQVSLEAQSPALKLKGPVQRPTSQGVNSQSQESAQFIMQNLRKELILSLKARDETGAIRVLIYSRNYVDLPSEILDRVNFPLASAGSKKSVN